MYHVKRKVALYCAIVQPHCEVSTHRGRVTREYRSVTPWPWRPMPLYYLTVVLAKATGRGPCLIQYSSLIEFRQCRNNIRTMGPGAIQITTMRLAARRECFVFSGKSLVPEVDGFGSSESDADPFTRGFVLDAA